MKTSNTQFEMLVNYMEQHGDVNKPSKTPGGRIANIKKWVEITNILNSDPTGEAKEIEKWKKVWSDLKNNTKKKAARINKAVSGTGGGPALKLKLTELEERVLCIIGSQAATGFTDVNETGISKEQQLEDPDRTITLSPTPPPVNDSPVILTMADDAINIDQGLWDTPGPSWQESNPPQSPPQVEIASVIQPRQEVCVTPMAEPVRPSTRAGHTPQHRQGVSTRRTLGSPRRPRRIQSNVDRTSEYFLRSDEEWRRFLIKKHEEKCEIRKIELQTRKMELQTQQKWQDIAMLAVNAIHKFIDKFWKD